jgi:hypothetical protein
VKWKRKKRKKKRNEYGERKNLSRREAQQRVGNEKGEED